MLAVRSRLPAPLSSCHVPAALFHRILDRPMSMGAPSLSFLRHRAWETISATVNIGRPQLSRNLPGNVWRNSGHRLLVPSALRHPVWAHQMEIVAGTVSQSSVIALVPRQLIQSRVSTRIPTLKGWCNASYTGKPDSKGPPNNEGLIHDTLESCNLYHSPKPTPCQPSASRVNSCHPEKKTQYPWHLIISTNLSANRRKDSTSRPPKYGWLRT